MSAVRRSADRIRLQLEPGEVRLLRSLRDGLVATLEQPDAADPVIDRLFPTAVLGDTEADSEVRSMLRDELLEQRRQGLDALVELLDRGTGSKGRVRVDLTEDEAALVLGVLNDLRLAIGARVDVEQIDRERLVEDDPVFTSLAVMDHLGWMQEQLLAVLDPPSVRVHDSSDED